MNINKINPATLKITDMRFADIDGAPKRCTLMKLYTNQGIVGYGEMRDASSRTYAAMLKSRILGENPCNVEKVFRPNTWPGFADVVRDGYAEFAACRDAASALAHLEDFRVLCALRHGPFGSEKIASWIRRTLSKNAPVPMMITQNDRTLDVNNGDVGVVMPGDRKTLCLPGRKKGETIRTIRLELLPETECAFASTVHKAQGSQFRDVAVVLPTTGDSPLLTCEILYTAVTRTEKSVAIFGGEPAVRACCERSIRRRSGLVPPPLN